ncbi:hypothetical protein [Nocardia sp. NPDC051570]|uniref:hypothetical protein n=1 Tax=Nocardia sp. NPDC051570 TaxID=3364324 RepID=UPI003788F8EC
MPVVIGADDKLIESQKGDVDSAIIRAYESSKMTATYVVKDVAAVLETNRGNSGAVVSPHG